MGTDKDDSAQKIPAIFVCAQQMILGRICKYVVIVLCRIIIGCDQRSKYSAEYQQDHKDHTKHCQLIAEQPLHNIAQLAVLLFQIGSLIFLHDCTSASTRFLWSFFFPLVYMDMILGSTKP